VAALALGAAALHIGVGTNLGNTLEAPVEGAWNKPAQEFYFTDWASRNFSTVRIPVRWDNHTGQTAPYLISPAFLSRVETIVGWCLEAGFTCLINAHWDSWLDLADDAAFAAQLPRYDAIWRQVGAAFASYPPRLLFESFNEPHLMSTSSMNTMLATFYAATRATNPTRTLILGWLSYMGPSWIQEDGGANFNAMNIPGNGTDTALLVETHSYDPWGVCGQGTVPWGAPGDVAAMGYMFGNLSLWSAAHGGLGVFMGECGCTRKQEQAQRVAWYTSFFQHVRNTPGIVGGLVWDDDGEFQVYNRSSRTYDEGVMGAIGLPAGVGGEGRLA
jgi:endoglucanase